MLHLLYLRDAIVAGSTARMVMILFIYAAPYVGLPRTDLIGLIGSLAAPNKEAAATFGGAIHFLMGVIFALIYAALWSVGIGSATWWWGLIFGAVHGLLALLLVALVVHMDHRLLEMIGGPSMLVALVVNHMAYGLVVAVVYASPN